jgi:Uncharacterized protein conserved in bacteria
MVSFRQLFPIFAFMICVHAWASGTVSAMSRQDDPAGRRDRNDAAIYINPLTNRMTVYLNGKEWKTYPIALGKPKTPTPVGDFVIINKYKNWGSGFGTRWMGLNVPWGIYGIHGTNKPHSIGTDASHGCIRMLNRHVEELYEHVPIGTRVYILGHVLGEPNQEPRRLAKGDTGSDVMLIQSRLRSAGYFDGEPNGKFGPQTEIALRKYERDHGLPEDGVVGYQDYESLGLLD